ncbi:MAG: hypothetical protein NWE91_03250, partial [Candidatus Bathyarchaeota archaeon]|nr:hypothetical protein [Candidatus Bathyarchaeota archaeon]
DFGEPIMNSTEENCTITLPIIFDNNGYYNIDGLNITTLITDYKNRRISEATTYIEQVPPQNSATIFHNVSFNLNEIMIQDHYLFNDSNFTLSGLVQLNYANLIPLGFEVNTTIPWGAPLFNFTIGMPEYNTYNSTYMRVNMPINFENHSPHFNVSGDILIEIFNDRHQLYGKSAVSIDVPSNNMYYGEIETLVNAAMVTERGQIRVYVETEMFSYGPMVISYG